MQLEGVAGAVMAFAARGAHAVVDLQIVEACTALPRRVGDVSVGDAVADTDDHAITLTRIVRISKYMTGLIGYPLRRWPGLLARAGAAGARYEAQEPICDCR
jgi:hypothetical protein